MKNKKYTTGLREIDPQLLDLPLLQSGGYHGFDRAIFSRKRQTDAFHVTYLARNEASWTLAGGQLLQIKGGQLGIIQPAIDHQAQWSFDTPNVHFWFYFQPLTPRATHHTPFPKSFLRSSHQLLAEAGNQVVPADATFHSLCNMLYEQLIQEPTTGTAPWLRALICSIFLSTLDNLKTQHRKSEQHQAISAAIALIEQNLGQELKVEALAASAGLTPDQFQKLFKQATGQTPWNYVLQARCQKACAYLLDRQRDITSIAYELGFSSSQHFATYFKKIIGLTPSQFRRRETSIGRR